MAPRKKPAKKVTLKKPVIRRSSQAASKKPIISIGTLVTVVVFAAVVLLGIYLNRQKETVDAEATPAFEEVKFLFDESVPSLSSIEVTPGEGSEGGVVKLARDDKNVWAFDPPAYEADQGLAEAAASQVSALEVVDTVENVNPADFGFDAPDYVIALEFSDGSARTLEVGDASPLNNGYYVRVDKGVIQLVRLSGIDALTQLAKTPPYAATPEPEVTPIP